MTLWIIGRGIVGRRLARMLDPHAARFHDPRLGVLPMRGGDIAVLCQPGKHAPLAEEIVGLVFEGVRAG